MNKPVTPAKRIPFYRGLTPMLSFLATITFASFPANARSEGLDLKEVAPGIYVHQGHQAGMDSPHRDDIANIGFIIGEECVAVIDSGGSLDIGRQLRSALHRISDKPVCYLVNTHVHYDHVLGNGAFGAEATQFVGHKNLRAAIENNRAFFLKNFSNELGTNTDPKKIKGPNMTVDGTKILDLGKRKIELTAHPTAHTDADLSILDKKTNTLWVSDLLFVRRIPVINGSLKGWIGESEKLLKRRVDTMIPGHGPLPKNWKAAIKTQLRYLKTLRDEIRKIIRKGGFLEDALHSVGLDEKDHWLLFEENHKRNVTRAFAELEWE